LKFKVVKQSLNDKVAAVLIGLMLIFVCRLAWADSMILSSYVEVGKKSTAEVFEEEDTDDDFSYYKYCLKLDHALSRRLKYSLSSWVYDKDYEQNDDLDNVSRMLKNEFSCLLRKTKEESLRLGLSLNYKEKRYENKPSLEYDQTKFSAKLIYKREDIWSLAGSAGIESYNYIARGEKDQLKYFGKVEAKRYLRSKKLLLSSSYRLGRTDHKQVGRERTKEDISAGFDYKFELPWIYRLRFRGKWGERDTKEEEERDEDYDYDYREWYVKTEHKISPRMSANLKYQYLEKDYLTGNLDHNGFYLLNGWKYEPIGDKKRRIYFDLGLKHKELDYQNEDTNDYRKNSVEFKATYQRKKSWECSLEIEGHIYDYPNDSFKDKERYYVKISWEKLFLERAFTLSVDLKYRYTDYHQRDDTEKNSVRVVFKYKF